MQWPIRWRPSRALGLPYEGRLVRGVKLPCDGRDFFTWDPILNRTPNRWWRRFGTTFLLRKLLRVARSFRASHPSAPRLTVADLSRPHGGDFGPRFGPPGHASHQNGLDVDVYYPRLDRTELAPTAVGQIDLRLSQQLVDRFVSAGAEFVFVGPSTGLHGPPSIVQELPLHNNHLHVRLPNPY
jgi:murein endopeptidase